jgi:formate dehydrogenase subunit delta
MGTEHLVEMANDIGAYFAVEKDRAKACEGIRGHILRYWEPRMRQKLIDHFERTRGDDLDERVRDAVAALARETRAPAPPHT